MKLKLVQKKVNYFSFLILLVGILFISGCISQNADKNVNQSGPETVVQPTQGLQIVFKDPGMPEVKYLQPTIKEIQLQNEGGKWITIWSNPEGKTVKLTSDGAEVDLDTVSVEAGTYVGTRLLVSTIDVEVDVNRDGDVSDKNVEIILTEEDFNKLPHPEKQSAPEKPQGEKPQKPNKPQEPSPPYRIVDGIVYTGNYLDEQHTVTLNDYIVPLGEQMWKTNFVYGGSGGKLIYDFTLSPQEQKGKQISVEVFITNPPLPPSVLTVSALTVSSDSVINGASSVGTVTLSSAAPTGGQVVLLSADPSESLALPLSIIVEAGETSGTFDIQTYTVTTPVNVIITAALFSLSLNNSYKMVKLTINPTTTFTVASLIVSPASIISGTSSVGTVTLDNAAPAGGQVVQLWADSIPVSLPSSVTVKAGETSGTFGIFVDKYAVTTPINVTIKAVLTDYNSYKTAQLTINPTRKPIVSALVLRPASVTHRTGSVSTVVGTVAFSDIAPPGGQVVQLSAIPKDYLVLPVNMTVRAGAREGTFNISISKTVTRPVEVIIMAKLDNSQQGARLTIFPPPSTNP